MTKVRNVALNFDDHITSVGKRLGDQPDWIRSDLEWMEGVHGSADGLLPTETKVPIPSVLYTLPELHPDRPRGSKPMIDVAGAKSRLKGCRPGTWLLSPFTGWKWAVWPSGHIGWLPKDVELPDNLRVSARSDIQ